MCGHATLLQDIKRVLVRLTKSHLHLAPPALFTEFHPERQTRVSIHDATTKS